MRLSSMAALAAAALAVPALAMAAPEATDWSGFYAGVHGGGDWSAARQTFADPIDQTSGVFIPGRGIVVVPGTTAPFPGQFDVTARRASPVFGGQLGWTGVSGAFAFGIEGDIRTGGQSSSATASAPLLQTAISPVATVSDTRSIRSDYAWSVRARLGVTWDRFFLYGTGGVAGAGFRYSAAGLYASPGGSAAPCGPPAAPGCSPVDITAATNAVSNTTAGSRSFTGIGWTAGVGGEVSLSRRFSLGLEYRHSDYGARTITLTSQDVSVSLPTYTAPAGASTSGGLASPPRVNFGSTRLALSDDLVTVRLNVHF